MIRSYCCANLPQRKPSWISGASSTGSNEDAAIHDYLFNNINWLGIVDDARIRS